MSCGLLFLYALVTISHHYGYAWKILSPGEISRENVFRWLRATSLTVSSALAVSSVSTNQRALAADELPPEIRQRVDFVDKVQRERSLLSDEFEIRFSEPSLGLSIRENIYNGFPILTVENYRESYPMLRKGAIITRVGDRSVDGLPMAAVIREIQEASRPVTLRFRDPTRFFELLDSVSSLPLRLVTSSYLPANAR